MLKLILTASCVRLRVAWSPTFRRRGRATPGSRTDQPKNEGLSVDIPTPAAFFGILLKDRVLGWLADPLGMFRVASTGASRVS
jgi:hypothetical protein